MAITIKVATKEQAKAHFLHLTTRPHLTETSSINPYNLAKQKDIVQVLRREIIK